MKKILAFILSFLLVFALTSCGEDKAEENEKAFKQYLSENGTVTVEEIDSAFSTEEYELPSDFFTNVKVDNTVIDVTMTQPDESSQNAQLYVWQNESKVYLVSDNTNVARYFDLAQLEVVYDQYVSQINGTTKVSDTIEDYLEQIPFEQYGLPELDLEVILKVISLSADDFTQVSENKYKLNDEKIFNKVHSLGLVEFTYEEYKDLLEENGVSFEIYVYFNGTNINGYELAFKATTEDGEQSSNIKLMLEYEENEICGLNIDITDKPSNDNISVQIKLENETLSVKAKVVDGESTIDVDSSLSSENIKVKININDENVISVDLSVKNTKLANIYSLNVEGNIYMNLSPGQSASYTVTISSGEDVNIPASIKALERLAINALDDLTNIQ